MSEQNPKGILNNYTGSSMSININASSHLFPGYPCNNHKGIKGIFRHKKGNTKVKNLGSGKLNVPRSKLLHTNCQ